MSTTASPFGLRPVYSPSGVVRPAQRSIAASYTTKIYNGDPVVIVAGGTLQKAVANSGRVDGVLMGCEYFDSTGKYNVSNWWPGVTAATEITAWVCEDPNMIYEAQCTAALTDVSDVGSHIAISTAVGTGSDLTGISLATLDVATLSTSTESQFQIDGLAPYQDNAWTDTYPIVRVRLANTFAAAPLTAF